MRKPFIEKLTELAAKDPKVILLVGDVGFSFLEKFQEQFPKQFINCGIAEQNMMGVASGLSRVGWKPVVYTMIPFILFRPMEQLRNDIGYANANVKLFGVQGSAAYKFLGMSHSAAEGEEKNILEKIPNINSYYPETEKEFLDSMETEYQRSGPAYFHI